MSNNSGYVEWPTTGTPNYTFATVNSTGGINIGDVLSVNVNGTDMVATVDVDSSTTLRIVGSRNKLNAMRAAPPFIESCWWQTTNMEEAA